MPGWNIIDDRPGVADGDGWFTPGMPVAGGALKLNAGAADPAAVLPLPNWNGVGAAAGAPPPRLVCVTAGAWRELCSCGVGVGAGCVAAAGCADGGTAPQTPDVAGVA